MTKSESEAIKLSYDFSKDKIIVSKAYLISSKDKIIVSKVYLINSKDKIIVSKAYLIL